MFALFEEVWSPCKGRTEPEDVWAGMKNVDYDPFTILTNVTIEPNTAFTWDHIGGDLPDGMDVSARGVLYGTPTEAGTFDFEVSVSYAECGYNKWLRVVIDDQQ